jgi:hypothetical protein
VTPTQDLREGLCSGRDTDHLLDRVGQHVDELWQAVYAHKMNRQSAEQPDDPPPA